MEWGPARPGVTMQKATIRPVPTPPLVSPNFTNLNPLRHWCWGPLSIMLRGGGSLRGALHSIGAMQPRVYYEAHMFEAKKKKLEERGNTILENGIQRCQVLRLQV